MPLNVLPLTAADTEAWAELYYPAFRPSNVGCLWTAEPSAESNKKFAKALAGALQSPITHVFKCVDTNLDDKVVAVAKWSIYVEPRSMEDVEKTFVHETRYPEENVEARMAFMDGIWSSQREVIGGKPHIRLDSLVCHPDHQRRGAGKMLLQWGLDKGDELGLINYLEASAAGRGLYLKTGYEPVRTFIFDGTKYGAPAPDVHVVRNIKTLVYARLRSNNHRL